MSRYIDSEKLIAEIERLREECSSPISVCNDILSLIEFMQEQPTKGYDEKYLNEKIAKAKKSWDGVDVDKFMDDVRGREQQEQPEVDLEKEVTHFVDDDKILSKFVKYDDALLIARHFYKLGLNARKEESK